MYKQAQGLTCFLFICLWSVLFANVPTAPVFAAEVPCQFKATETTEVHILVDGKTLWAGSIEKAQTKTVSVPEGPFTVVSKVYNQNLKMKEDVRTEMHARQCQGNAVLTVPLFENPSER